MFKQIKLSFLYEFIKGSNNYNKKTINETQGNIPVYSGQTQDKGIIGYTLKEDFEGNFLRVITVGDAGNVFIISGKFCLAQNNGILVPLKNTNHEQIDLNYIRFQLIENLPKCAKGEGKQKSLLKQDIENFVVSIPVKENGEFDLQKQNEISKKFMLFEDVRKNLKASRQKLKNLWFELELSNYSFIQMQIKDIFDLNIPSNGSKFTKGFIVKNPGTIPVYGASKFEDEVGYGFVSDNAVINSDGKNIPVKYFEDCLTYNIDGTAGYIFYRRGKFSLSEKVKPLIIQNQYKEEICYEYLKYLLQPVFRKNTKGRKGPNGENEFSKLSITDIENIYIDIPINKDGKLSIEIQKEIAEKFDKLNKTRINMENTLDKVLSLGIKIE